MSPGAFSGERVFEVKLANGDSYRSLTPRQFCWNDNGHLVEENEPTTEVTGMIAARIVDSIDDEQVIVEVPDGEIIAVERDTVKDRPTNIKLQYQSHMYLSDRDLKFAVETGQLIVDPPPEEFDTTSIDLHLDKVDQAKVWNVEAFKKKQAESGNDSWLRVGKYK